MKALDSKFAYNRFTLIIQVFALKRIFSHHELLLHSHIFVIGVASYVRLEQIYQQ